MITLLSLFISFHNFHKPGTSRLPHDVLVEQGLPPNPGPISSSSSNDRAREDPEDDGSTPGLYSHGNVDCIGDQREGEQENKRAKIEKNETQNLKNTFCDKKRKHKSAKNKSEETITF